MASRSRPIALAAGGTGGHVFPAEVLAEELQCRGHAVVFITDQRGISWYRTRECLVISTASAERLVSNGMLFGILTRSVRLARGLAEALLLLWRLKPAVVIGFGSYASVLPVIAAVLAGYPTIIHEQNAVLGRANRWLAPLVNRVAVSFAKMDYTRVDRFCTGMPVRPALQLVRDIPYTPPNSKDVIHILVIGGSQGAHIFSEVVPAALSRLPIALRTRLYVSQQVRAEDHAAVATAYNVSGIVANLSSFFNDVSTLLAEAHLVITRAGASTVAELTVAGRPAILVPYPHAIDDHQAANASAVGETCGAWIIQQKSFTPAILAERLETLLALPDALANAAMCARAIAIPNAAKRLADVVESLIPFSDSKFEPISPDSGTDMSNISKH